MADVGATLLSWSAVDGSNLPSGATAIGTGLDDNLRAIQGGVVRSLSHKGVDIASSTTPALGGTEGLFHDITGTVTITGFDTVREGLIKIVKFEGALTLTHNATNLILPGGANITTADKDVAIFISEGSGNWRCLSYTKATGKAVINTANTQQTRQKLTSGSSATYTTPTGVTRIIVRAVGGGGGGAASTANNGTAGNNTTFGTMTAGGGAAGAAAGAGGAGGTCSGGDINSPGSPGGAGGNTLGTAQVNTGNGGGSLLGGGALGGFGATGANAAANSGGGGGGGGMNAGSAGGGGGGGGYCELLILAPSTTYTYTVGAAANGGSAGGFAGGNGGSGLILVDEYYD